MTDKLLMEKDGPIGWMIFNNPERRNAVSMEMWAAMAEYIQAFEADDEIRVIVLKGAGGKAFVAGADISEFDKKRSSASGSEVYNNASEAATRALSRASKPTIAMIHGYCIGGGVAISLCCDLRIASTSSTFGIPAAKLGLGYGQAGVKNLMDIVGPSFAKEIFFTARRFSGEEAANMGLINRVVADDELETYTRDYCRRIGENAPLTIYAAKQTVAELLKPSDKIDYARCAQLVKDCFDSEDYKEGRRAFMEKRTPEFKGR